MFFWICDSGEFTSTTEAVGKAKKDVIRRMLEN
jgi:hypothetical protein